MNRINSFSTVESGAALLDTGIPYSGTLPLDLQYKAGADTKSVRTKVTTEVAFSKSKKGLVRILMRVSIPCLVANSTSCCCGNNSGGGVTPSSTEYVSLHTVLTVPAAGYRSDAVSAMAILKTIKTVHSGLVNGCLCDLMQRAGLSIESLALAVADLGVSAGHDSSHYALEELLGPSTAALFRSYLEDPTFRYPKGGAWLKEPDANGIAKSVVDSDDTEFVDNLRLGIDPIEYATSSMRATPAIVPAVPSDYGIKTTDIASLVNAVEETYQV